MATAAFEAARSGIAGLFGRFFGGDRQAAIVAQLDEDVNLVLEASGAEQDEIRGELVPVWRRRLARLLREHPEAESDLRRLVVEMQEALPAEREQWVQHNIARDQGSVYAAQGGNVIHYQLADQQLPAVEDVGEGS